MSTADETQSPTTEQRSMPIIIYVKGHTLDDMQFQVNKYYKQGYGPFGGPAFGPTANKEKQTVELWTQGMIRDA
jgi:hypothetical protein